MASSAGVLSYHLSRLSIGLKKMGHSIVVLSGSKEQTDGLSAELSSCGIDRYVSDHIDKTGFHDICESKNDIQKILETEHVDVVHAQGATHSLGAYFAVKSLHPAERPTILTSVHSTPMKGLLQAPKWQLMTTILNRYSDGILAVSNYTKTSLMKHGLNPLKTTVIHNGLDLTEFDDNAQMAKMDFETGNSDRPAIACVANLTPTKGQQYYLMAARDVLKKHPARFYVVGDGPQRKYLEKLACSLHIEEDVVFTGRIQWPEIYFFLSNVANICVSASISENFPFYILECMAACKPVVATNVGGVSEAIIDGVNAYLVPPRDSTSMANAMLELVNNPEGARDMGASGRKLVEQKFAMETLAKKLTDVYATAHARI